MPSYENAPDSLIAHWDFRRAPMTGLPNGGLPALDVDLAPYLAGKVVPPDAAADVPSVRIEKKLQDLRRELAGCSDLALLNGLLIAHLRKRAWPDDAPALFRRLWVEHREALMAELPLRWLISSAITFATHGEDEAERRLGQSLNVLFSLIKLYEFERSFSGSTPEQPFRASRRNRPALPMGLPSFALVAGKLDIEFLAPIWAEAQVTPVLGPLACHLLRLLNDDPGTLFRRITLMRAEAVALRKARADGEAAG